MRQHLDSVAVKFRFLIRLEQDPVIARINEMATSVKSDVVSLRELLIRDRLALVHETVKPAPNPEFRIEASGSGPTCPESRIAHSRWTGRKQYRAKVQRLTEATLGAYDYR